MIEYNGLTYLNAFPNYDMKALLLIVQSDIQQYIENYGKTLNREITEEELKQQLDIFTNAEKGKEKESYLTMIVQLAKLRNVKSREHIQLQVKNYDKEDLEVDEYEGIGISASSTESSDDNNLDTKKDDLSTHDNINNNDVETDESEVTPESSEIDIVDADNESINHRSENKIEDVIDSKLSYEYLAIQRISDLNYQDDTLIPYDRFTHEGYKQIASRTIYKNIELILANKRKKSI